MNAEKTSKKVLKNKLTEVFLNSLTSLDLPQPSKKIRKVVAKQSKEVAAIYSDILKKEARKQRKAEKLMNKALSGAKNETRRRAAKEVKSGEVKK